MNNSIKNPDTLDDLEVRVRQWGVDKGLTGPGGRGTLKAQANKMFEEATETRDAVMAIVALEAMDDLSNENYCQCKAIESWKEPLKDGIGDVFVTIVLLATLAGLTLEECVEHSLNIIEKRTGKMVEGTFVKDA